MNLTCAHLQRTLYAGGLILRALQQRRAQQPPTWNLSELAVRSNPFGLLVLRWNSSELPHFSNMHPPARLRLDLSCWGTSQTQVRFHIFVRMYDRS
jgi:hypothetical protein